MRKKVLLLSNVPSPYLSPVYAHLKAEVGWDLNVCYVSSWNAGVGWSQLVAQQYVGANDLVLAKNNSVVATLFGIQLTATLALLAQAIKFRPDYLLIYGYTQLPQLTLLLWAFLFRVPFAIAGDANYHTDNATGWRRTLKRWWLCYLVQHAAALIVVGTACRNFWEYYGAQPHQLFRAGFAVDNDYFQKASAAARAAALQLREQFGWNDSTVFLYVGRLIKRKNVHQLIAAIKQMTDLSVALLIAGDGEERRALELLAQNNQRIRFVGRLTQQELPLCYALADALVLPAEAEPWGLVINEAMACGLSVMAHQHCGATLDLVSEDNGIILQSHTEEELNQAIRRMAEDKKALEKMKRQSLIKIQSWSMSSAAASLRDAVEATGCFTKRPDWSQNVILPDRRDVK